PMVWLASIHGRSADWTPQFDGGAIAGLEDGGGTPAGSMADRASAPTAAGKKVRTRVILRDAQVRRRRGLPAQLVWRIRWRDRRRLPRRIDVRILEPRADRRQGGRRGRFSGLHDCGPRLEGVPRDALEIGREDQI